MKNKILELIFSKPKHFSKIVKNDSELWNWVVSNSLVTSDNLSEMIYSAVYHQTNTCKVGKTKKFKSVTTGYGFCGKSAECPCAHESVSQKVSISKSSFSNNKKEEINKKREATTMSRYGVVNNAQTLTAKDNHSAYYKTLVKKIIPKKLTFYQKLNVKFQSKALVQFVTTEKDYLGVINQQYYTFSCLTCNNIFSDYINNGHLPVCKECHPYQPSYVSNQEIEVANYVRSVISEKVITSDKSIINPYELDIVIPAKKIAIEYCGLYWHSEVHKDSNNYHKNKMDLCNQKGYRLVTIFEDEWVHNRLVVENRLNSILHIDKKIPARKCKIIKLDYHQASTFLKKYHLQGASVFKTALGCEFNGELVSVMTFGSPRYDKSSEVELIRYCSKGTVVGGASKLFSHFVKQFSPASVVSYCDLRWGNGNLYSKLGFIKSDKLAKPSYSYTDFVYRYHRSRFTKQRLLKGLADTGKTEKELAADKKLYRIWDCGQDKWLWINSKTDTQDGTVIIANIISK